MTRRAGRRPRRHPRPPRGGGGRTLAWLVLFVVIAVAGGWLLVRDVVEGGADAPAPTAEEPLPAQPFLVREGLRREEVAELVDERTDLSGERYLQLTGPGPRGARLSGRDEPTSLEGFLFPATYEIGTETTVEDLVDAQIAAYRANTADIDYAYAARRNLTEYDVLIIASMVEREVAVARERRLVAGVIYNRLRAGMTLGIDATVQYALGEWKESLTVRDLEIDSPYNTRRYPGLPPGPIASPGRESLRAAARPAQNDLLYYVARNDGTGRHYFSETFEQFQRDVQRARRNGG